MSIRVLLINVIESHQLAIVLNILPAAVEQVVDGSCHIINIDVTTTIHVGINSSERCDISTQQVGNHRGYIFDIHPGIAIHITRDIIGRIFIDPKTGPTKPFCYR